MENKQPTFEEVFKDFAQFSKDTFVKSTASSSLIHLRDEIDEVVSELWLKDRQPGTFNRKELLAEYADCFLCLISSATRADVTVEELVKAMDEKTQINKGREWTERPNGTYKHVKK
jgi:hypothetical protein